MPKPAVRALTNQRATPHGHSATFVIIHPTRCIALLVAPTHGGDEGRKAIR